jgi:hypothetical protein
MSKAVLVCPARIVTLAGNVASVVSDEERYTTKSDAGAMLAVTVAFRVPPSDPLAGTVRLSVPTAVMSKVFEVPITAELGMCSTLPASAVPVDWADKAPDQTPDVKVTTEGEAVATFRRVKRMFVRPV